MSDEWKSFREKGRIVERAFTKKHLTDTVESNNFQDYTEHWDVAGKLNGKVLKFDVKGLKKKNRWDNNTQDECAWVEGTNVRGQPGWIKGKADYIVFERNDYWLVVNREELFNFIWGQLKNRGFPKGKEIYHVYDRSRWGKKDKITLVPYTDIEKLKDIKKLDK